MMIEVLQIPHAATIYFQKQDLTPGECLLHSREVMFKLKLDNNSASALATALLSRQEFLLRKAAFLAAVCVSSVC